MTSSRPPIHSQSGPALFAIRGSRMPIKKDASAPSVLQKTMSEFLPTTCRIMNDRAGKISRRLLATVFWQIEDQQPVLAVDRHAEMPQKVDAQYAVACGALARS